MEEIKQEILNVIKIIEEKIDLIKKSMEKYKKQNIDTVQHYSDTVAEELIKNRKNTYEDFFEKINLMMRNFSINHNQNIYKMFLKEVYENDFLSKKSENDFYDLMNRDIQNMNIENRLTYSIVTEFYAKNAEADLKYYKKLLKVLKYLKETTNKKQIKTEENENQ